MSEINNLKKEASNLEKKDTDLIIADLDNTIFSTKETTDLNLLGGRRGIEGNKYILEELGIDKFIKKIYNNKKCPSTIISQLRENLDLILTAGVKEIQTRKIEALGLDKINYEVVEKAEEKIIKTLYYVINTLKFIPNKVVIYEDRPEYFIEEKKLIEDILQTKVVINKVIMASNEEEPEIKEVA